MTRRARSGAAISGNPAEVEKTPVESVKWWEAVVGKNPAVPGIPASEGAPCAHGASASAPLSPKQTMGRRDTMKRLREPEAESRRQFQGTVLRSSCGLCLTPCRLRAAPKMYQAHSCTSNSVIPLAPSSQRPTPLNSTDLQLHESPAATTTLDSMHPAEFPKRLSGAASGGGIQRPKHSQQEPRRPVRAPTPMKCGRGLQPKTASLPPAMGTGWP